jgi:hypothetical protein
MGKVVGWLLLAAVVVWLASLNLRSAPSPAAREPLVEPPPHDLAVWPWPTEVKRQLQNGLTLTTSVAADGTKAELFEADYSVNPHLKLGLYDLDQDDERPFDDAAEHSKTVDELLPHLEQISKSKVLLAWNGPFFAYDFADSKPIARHIGPVVQQGKLRYNVGNHRWTLVSKDFKLETLHLPSRKQLEAKQADWAVAGVQCLVRDAKPLRLEPFPRFEDEIRKAPVPSSPEEAGHIPLVDHMRTSRTSIAWSKDGSKLFILLIIEADHELGSKLGLKRGEAQESGWTLADLQRFWLAQGAWGAINSDGGDVTQRVYRAVDGTLQVLKPKKDEGTLLTFYLRIED